MFKRLRYSFILLFLISLTAFFTSCSELPNEHWISAVPEKAPAVFIPEEEAVLNDVLESNFAPFLDDISPSAIQLLSEVELLSDTNFPLEAVILFPGTSREIHPVWLLEAPGGVVQDLREEYYNPFEQNRYTFHDQTVHILYVEDHILYAVQVNDYMMVSESSLGIEDAIRSYLGEIPSVEFDEADLEPASVLLNTPSLDRWIEQLGKVEYRPAIMDAFEGTGPVLLQANTSEGDGDEETQTISFSGNIPLSEDKTELIASVSSENSPLQLDRYISSNAAAFGIFHLEPRSAPPREVENATELDSLLMENNSLYSDLSVTLDTEFALVMYPESGFLNVGEHLFLRSLKDPGRLEELLEELEEDDVIEQQGDAYFLQSTVLGKLIGSQMSSYLDFYLEVVDDAVVISRRNGLVDLVASDHDRRRVVYYEDEYMDIREGMSDALSFLFIANSDFESYVQPFLAPENNFGALASRYDLLSASAELNDQQDMLSFTLNTHQQGDRDQPFEEQWYFGFSEGELTGKPVLENVRGSSRDEIIFATDAGEVYVLVSDGTAVTEIETEDDDVPVGSPVVHDWYGAGQNVIMIAAGDKVYAWDDNGNSLPRFPFELKEQATSPLVIHDINRDGMPEALVATADRRIHALDGRGNNIDGWPVTTNAEVMLDLLVEQFKGSRSLIAFSENTVHAWNDEGEPHSDFPKFIDASFTTSPSLNGETIYGGAADGYLYVIDDSRTLTDSLNVFNTLADTANIEAAYVSNSELRGKPAFYENVTVANDDETITENMILTMSADGSIFLINEDGQLRFTESMGQPSAPSYSPEIVDLDGDLRNEVVALADFGRIYAWRLEDGERLYSLPTSAMKFPVIADINEDGNQELIAQTGNGLRLWRIYRQD